MRIPLLSKPHLRQTSALNNNCKFPPHMQGPLLPPGNNSLASAINDILQQHRTTHLVYPTESINHTLHQGTSVDYRPTNSIDLPALQRATSQTHHSSNFKLLRHNSHTGTHLRLINPQLRTHTPRRWAVHNSLRHTVYYTHTPLQELIHQ
jgi:hypothetical protein